MKIYGRELHLLILDVDGVLLSIENLSLNMRTAAMRCGLPVEPVDYYFREVRAGRIEGNPDFHRGLEELWPGRDGKIDEYIAYFIEEEARNPYLPVVGCKLVLDIFNKHSVPIALCTNNSTRGLETKLLRAELDQAYFTFAATIDTGYAKPDPRALDPIFERIGVKRDSALYVGDWYPDLEAARGGDVEFIASLSGGIPRHAFLSRGVPEDHIIESLPNLLEKLMFV